MNALALTTVSKLKHSEHSNYWNIGSLQYNSLFLITRPPPLETSASQTSYFIIHVWGTRSQLNYTWSLGGDYACAVYCMQCLLSFGASTVYTCSKFSVLSKKMVFLSATVVQRGCGKCLLPWSLRDSLRCNGGSAVIIVLTCTSYQWVMILTTRAASWSIYCGDEKHIGVA